MYLCASPVVHMMPAMFPIQYRVHSTGSLSTSTCAARGLREPSAVVRVGNSSLGAIIPAQGASCLD